MFAEIPNLSVEKKGVYIVWGEKEPFGGLCDRTGNKSGRTELLAGNSGGPDHTPEISAATEILGEQPKVLAVSRFGAYREFPASTGNSGDSTGHFCRFRSSPFGLIFHGYFSLSSKGSVAVDNEKYIWCRTTPKSASRSPLLIVRCFLFDSRVNKRE
jgi:hypothetical protein